MAVQVVQQEAEFIGLRPASRILALSIDVVRELCDRGRIRGVWRTPGGPLGPGARRIPLQAVLELRRELRGEAADAD